MAGHALDGWVRRLGAHLDQYIGGKSRTLTEIMLAGIQMDLWVHEPTKVRPYQTVFTSGMSWLPMHAPRGKARHAELLMYLPPTWNLFDDEEERWWPGKLLKQLGRMVHDTESWFGPGHTIQNEDPPEPYTPGSLLSHCVLLEPPEKQAFTRLELEDDSGNPRAFRFLRVVPITADECTLVRRRGVAGLFRAFGSAGPPRVLDPARACVVTGRSPLPIESAAT